MSAQTTTDTLDLDEIRELLADVTFRPFAQYPWGFDGERQGEDLEITLKQNFARDSSDFDPFAEYDEWTVMDGGIQTFTRLLPWPCSPDQLRRCCAEIAAGALAHEALEWLWWGTEKCYDPHVQSDVTVIL